MRRLFIVTFCMVLTPFLSLATNHYYFRTVDVKDGLADNFVRDITRDSYGYIWIATINGISRYDGYRLINYMPQELGEVVNDVRIVRETADSTLWMLCNTALMTYKRTEGTWQNDGKERLSKMGIEGSLSMFSVDEKYNLWVTTDYGLFHYDYAEHKLYHFNQQGVAPVTHIVSRDDHTLAITSDLYIYKVRKKDERLIPVTNPPSFAYSRDNNVYLDSHLNLWLYQSHTSAGQQWIYSLKDHQWRYADELKVLGNVTVNVISEDQSGNIWVGTGNTGVGIFPRLANGKISPNVRIEHAFRPHGGHIGCFFLDKNNTMWVGSGKLGIAFTDLNSPDFDQIPIPEHEDVSALAEDAAGNLWIGFDGSGVMKKSPHGTSAIYSTTRHSLPSDIITSILVLPDGGILAGTYGNGIARFDGTRFSPYYPEFTELKYVKDMTVDGNGNLWVATVDKGVIMLTDNGSTVSYTSDNSKLPSNGTLCLAYNDVRNHLYIGTSAGLAIYDLKKRGFEQPEGISQLSSSYITAFLLTSKRQLWIGSRDGLWIYSPDSSSVSHLTTDQGLSHNVIRALAESSESVWASTDNGLTRIAIESGTYKCHPFYDNDGLHNIIFSNNAALTTRKGIILLGNYTGYTSIQPDRIIAKYPRMHVEFAEFRINGKMVSKDVSDFSIEYGERLGISLSVMIPVLSPNVRYLYRFKGEKEWTKAPNNMLYFASLLPGQHVLQVKAVLGASSSAMDNLPDTPQNNISELSIGVLPPIWLTKWAFLLYFLLVIFIVYLVYRAMKRQQKRELAIKQMEINLKKYEMEEEKISFFTNISHDIKTPLTMVIAPLEKIRETTLPAAIRTEVDVAWQNAKQLYDLVLELLDFRRLDVGKEKIHLSHGELVSFVKQTVQGFSYYAARKHIKIQLRLPSSPVETLFDENKMRRIITNLLSNACKYNVENGTIIVSLDIREKAENHGEIILGVADTGIGVNDKHHIFDRFMQERHGQEQEGSGLGLHIVREYVMMMGGTVNVTDNKPAGTIFTVTLPMKEACQSTDAEELEIGEETFSATSEQHHKPVILIVEDNTDARLFLQRSLEDEYQTIVAANGKEALQRLSKTEGVTLIISDVMMPEMDGIEMVRQIKKNIKFSHIPIILLTAKSSEENIVEGLESGVADYITKPFSLAVLRLRVKKIIEWTHHVHEKVATGIEIKPSEITVSSLDEELIGKVIAAIEENIQNADYSVVQLSNAVNMTRGNLYKKLMAIVGKSPVEFIRIIRLERGKNLLNQGRTNISEVADMVGFSPKLFAQYFKAMYGDTPSEYLRKNKQKQ